MAVCIHWISFSPLELQHIDLKGQVLEANASESVRILNKAKGIDIDPNQNGWHHLKALIFGCFRFGCTPQCHVKSFTSVAAVGVIECLRTAVLNFHTGISLYIQQRRWHVISMFFSPAVPI